MEKPYGQKIIFFDDYWLDFKKNIMRRWYTPDKLSEFVDPSLKSGGCYNTVTWSPEQGKYLMWYEYLVDNTSDEERYIAMAESDDGINWLPADVNKNVDIDKRLYSNTVYQGNIGVHGCYVMRDQRDPDPQRRYKMAGATRAARYRVAGIQNSAVHLSTSPDGINWTEQENSIIHPHTSDTSNCIYYNPVTGEYNTIIRAGFVDRRICHTSSNDLVIWSRPKVIVHPGPDFGSDAFAVQLYGMPVSWMDGYFVGGLWRYYTSCADFDFSKMKGFQDSELMYSYDGENWMRTSGQAIIERPLPPAFGFSSLTLDDFFQSKDGDRQFIVCSGSRSMHCATEQHDELRKMCDGATSAAVIYGIRKDGWCGLEANTTDGLIITKSFELCGGDLFFNLNSSFGRARFSVLHHDGTPYERFGLDDCVPFSGDALRHRPVFKNADISELKGQRIRLSIMLDSATLHCVEGDLRPWIRFPQVSMNDPCHV